MWAPLSQAVTLNLYHQGHENYDNSGKPSEEKTPYKQVQLVKIENGAWEAKLDEDVSFKYYTFTVETAAEHSKLLTLMHIQQGLMEHAV